MFQKFASILVPIFIVSIAVLAKKEGNKPAAVVSTRGDFGEGENSSGSEASEEIIKIDLSDNFKLKAIGCVTNFEKVEKGKYILEVFCEEIQVLADYAFVEVFFKEAWPTTFRGKGPVTVKIFDFKYSLDIKYDSSNFSIKDVDYNFVLGQLRLHFDTLQDSKGEHVKLIEYFNSHGSDIIHAYDSKYHSAFCAYGIEISNQVIDFIRARLHLFKLLLSLDGVSFNYNH